MEASQVPSRRIGELLVGNGLITEQELEGALAQQASTDERLGEILVARRLVSSTDLTNVLMEQLGRELAGQERAGSWAGRLKSRGRSVRAIPRPPFSSAERVDHGIPQLERELGQLEAELHPDRVALVAEQKAHERTGCNLELASKDVERLNTLVSEREARIAQLEAELASLRSPPET